MNKTLHNSHFKYLEVLIYYNIKFSFRYVLYLHKGLRNISNLFVFLAMKVVILCHLWMPCIF